jgi:hypothetical protein
MNSPTTDEPIFRIEVTYSHLVKLLAAAVILLAGVFLALIPIGPMATSPYWEIFFVSAMLGTALCHVTLAGMWAALGDNSFLPRIGMSAGWVIGLFAMFAAGQSLRDLGPPEDFYVIAGAFVGGLWIVGQLPFWAAAVSFGWRLRRTFDSTQKMQFGLREILIATGAIATLMGILRVLIEPKWIPTTFEAKAFFICVFYALAFYLGMLPAVLSFFLLSRWKLALGASLLFMAILTLAEWQVALALGAASGGPPQVLPIFIYIHATELFWMLLICGIMRWGGYRLVRS